MIAKKRNPRAPLLNLLDAIKYGMDIYEVAALRSIAIDAAAAAVGYKDSRSGAAQQRLATLKQYGILRKEGKSNISVSEKIQILKFAPTQKEKFEAADSLFKSPPIFSKLLEKYNGSPPDDSILRFDLINLGFDQAGADNILKYFRESYDYIMSFNEGNSLNKLQTDTSVEKIIDNSDINKLSSNVITKAGVLNDSDECQDILIRLPNKRKAMLSIPVDFSEKDKIAIKQQVDALWIDDE